MHKVHTHTICIKYIRTYRTCKHVHSTAVCARQQTEQNLTMLVALTSTPFFNSMSHILPLRPRAAFISGVSCFCVRRRWIRWIRFLWGFCLGCRASAHTFGYDENK
jgi:hypothetical protein